MLGFARHGDDCESSDNTHLLSLIEYELYPPLAVSSHPSSLRHISARSAGRHSETDIQHDRLIMRLPLLVVLKHVVVALQHIRDAFAKVPSWFERHVLNGSANWSSAHDFDHTLLRLYHGKVPVLKVVLLTEVVVSGSTNLLNFIWKIHHLQSVFVVSSRHGRIVASSPLGVTRLPGFAFRRIFGCQRRWSSIRISNVTIVACRDSCPTERSGPSRCRLNRPDYVGSSWRWRSSLHCRPRGCVEANRDAYFWTVSNRCALCTKGTASAALPCNIKIVA
jgi:hypothetical protein